jgi:hypothetical protein
VKFHSVVEVAEQSATFDAMLSDMDVSRLFNEGALYFDRTFRNRLAMRLVYTAYCAA